MKVVAKAQSLYLYDDNELKATSVHKKFGGMLPWKSGSTAPFSFNCFIYFETLFNSRQK